MNKKIVLPLLLVFIIKIASAQSDYKDYANFDFVPGETILFDDNLASDKPGASPLMWNIEGGKATVINEDEGIAISIDEYYTKLSPKFKGNTALPDTFTIEYDTWLDAGYDGNPGIQIHLMNGDNEATITPNKHELSVNLPNSQIVSKDNPEEYFGENKFYNRWVHISIACMKKHLTVYLDHYKQVDIDDCGIKPQKILVSGDESGGMKILLKNFKVAKNIPQKFEIKNGKFITHAIKFDVNKAIIKPESMTVLKEVAGYLKANAAIKFEIGGHTDSDGDDASNMKLSENRAADVKEMLVSLGVNEAQLTAKGYGESKPIDTNATPEGKANNRRVEFTEIK